jgi:putative ABC transport system permease protein
LIQDLRYACRSFAKSPGFTAAAVLSLAIGIGANTSIFSVANALLLRPLPYPEVNRLVILWNRSPGLNITQDWFSTAQYFDIKSSHSGFEQLAIAIGGYYNLTGTGEPERVSAIRVSSNLLSMFGATAAQGRLFVSEEDAPGRAATAILSYGTWARRYGSDPRVVGQSITLNGQSYQIAGVLPRSFSLPLEVLPILGGVEQAEIFLPLPLAASAATVRTREDYNIVARLRPGVSVERAQAEMNSITARLRAEHPDVYPPNGGLTFSIVPLLEQVVGDVRRTLGVLLGTVGFVLLIACANVANLLLSRAVGRQQEIAVRTALGAAKSRIVRQLLTESLALALFGGLVGALIAFWSMRWIHAMGTQSIPRLAEISIDWRVLLFTLLLSAVSGIVFGLVPALRVSNLDLHTSLKDAGRGSAGASAVWGRGNNVRRLLVAGELALSVVLLIGAGLLIRSFAGLQNVQPGFNARNVLTFGLTMTGRKYADSATVLNTYRDLWQRMERLPGVSAAGGIQAIPLGQLWAWGPITVEGRVPRPGENFLNADKRVVSGHYFQAMEIPLLRGRFFNDQDTAANPRVIIVDDYMARELWPNQDAIGKRVRCGSVDLNAPWCTVVGIVGRVKQYSLDSDSRIAMYIPHTQNPSRVLTAVLRSGSDPAALSGAVKKEIRQIDPDLPVYQVRTMTNFIEESLARRRFTMALLGIFAGIALLLAAIGIYGVMAYLVNQGTREIGIRLALGATQSGILGMVMRQGMTLALTGVGAGLIGAFALTRLLRSFLYGVQATDPLTFAAIALLLAAVALLASFIPARRASRIDPMISLRCE